MQKKVLSFSLKAWGWALSNLGRLLPGLTARLFFRLYATPPRRRKLTDSLLAARAQAEVGEVALSKYVFDPGLLKLATYRWGRKGKKVLLMHGWGSSALGFPALTDALIKAGYIVISYDAPAHGFSEGRRTNLPQWIHVLDQFLRREGPFYAIIGHSVGALCTGIMLARKGHVVPKLVLATPPLSAPGFFQDTFDLFRIKPKVADKVYQLVETQLKDDLRTMDLQVCIDAIRAERILVVYDEQDQLVKHTEIDAWLAQQPKIQSLKISGDGHFRVLKNKVVVEKIILFLGEE